MKQHYIPKILTVVVIVFTLLALSFSTGFDSLKGEEKIIESTSSSSYVVSPFQLPDSLSFAGESVPLDYFDVRESLDRELMVNTYWHSQSLYLLKAAHRYFPEIEKILKENNIPDDFKYVVMAESGFRDVVSPSGASGFWQFMEKTAIEYKLEVSKEVDERYHLEKATKAACRYIKDAYSKFSNWTLVAASYNVGMTSLRESLQSQKVSSYYDLLLNQETARYVYRILAFKIIYMEPEKYGFTIPENEYYKQVPYTTIKVDKTIENLADFAQKNNTNYKLLKYLNPWLISTKLTVAEGKRYEIKIPSERSVE